MSSRLFGTDGVRGKAGEPPLDRRTIRRLGAALVRALPRTGAPIRILIGRDTRESGEWIEREFASGARSEAACVTSAAVIPTPAIAFLARSLQFDAGVVISASHNPFADNGIKVFSGAGEKFTERLEVEVEAFVADSSWEVPDDRGDAGEPVERVDFIDSYIEHLRAILPTPGRLAGMPIAIDCANGATTTVAPRLFRSLGFEPSFLGNNPDGRNINLRSGSTHPELLAQTVRTRGHRLGVAFDGDGDRAIFADHSGAIVDGDAVMLMCAKQLKAEARLRGNAVVATVMSNIGLELALRELDIDLIRCQVGDKYVMEEMLKRGLSLGGEQSGHIIFADYLFTGDGLCTALSVMRTMEKSGRELADLAKDLVTYPQVLLNVRVRQKVDLRQVPAVSGIISDIERRLGDHGRLLVRYSGTEPLLRVMLEGRDPREIREWAEQIAASVRQHLG